MATLKDIWNYNSNTSSGNVADTTHWSGDNSYGLDKRINDLITGTYKSWPNINPSTDLSVTPLVASQQLAKYVNYMDSFSDDQNLTFRQIYNHELVEWSFSVNGATVSSMEIVNDPTVHADRVLLKMTTSAPHGFANGDRLNGFAFAGTFTGGYNEDILNWEDFYCKLIDSTSFYVWHGAVGTMSSTNPRLLEGTIAGEDIQPLNYWFVRQNAGGYDGALLCFPSQGWWDPGCNACTPVQLSRSEVTGDTFKIRADHSGNSLAGTIDSAAVETTVYLEKVRNNVYKVFTDSARTTPFTITSEVTGPSTHTVSYSSTVGSYTSLNDTITSASLHAFLVSHSITSFRASRTSLPTSFVGVCRLNLNAGTSSSNTKTIPTSLDQSDHFYYLYRPGWGANYGSIFFYEDLGAINNFFSDVTWNVIGWIEHATTPVVWAPNLPTTQQNAYPKGVEVQSVGSNEVEVEFINAWQLDMAHHKVPGDVYYDTTVYGGNMVRAETGGIYSERSYPLTVGSQGISGSQTLAGPLVGRYNEIYPYDSSHISTPSSWPEVTDLMAGMRNPTMYLPGAQVYSYQNSSNVKTYAAGSIDFTKHWMIGDADPAGRSFSWPTTAPDIVPNVNSSGYLDNTYTINNPGKISLASIDNTLNNEAWISRINDTSHSTWAWGVSKFQQRADDYVAPTPYAEDVFDTDSEWNVMGFDDFGFRKQWPQHIKPRSIKVIQATPSSTTTSQSGIKYVRTTGIVKHQLEVTYPPMNETAFREFEATVAAAGGQATPFYLNFVGYGGSALAFTRIDEHATGVSNMALRYDVTTGDNNITLEGFEANKTDAILKGEYMVLGGSRDGNLMQAVSGDDANVFGEVTFRMNMAARLDYTAGQGHIYKQPSHAIVTLAEDTLEYNIGMDQLYTFTVRFDFDEWK